MLWNGKKNIKVLYKDNVYINQKSKYLENCNELAGLIKLAKEENNYSKYFLDESKILEQNHNPVHNECEMKENSSNKLTEKRICRCMYYYGKNDDKCRKCPLDKKFRNISNKFKIIDYEVPTKFVIEDCGGIDLLIKDEETGEMYATEVKPKNSSETLVRMVAEIFTYTANDTDVYKKAIAFFSDSKQEKDYFNELYMKDENFNYILNQVTVFRIVANEKDDGVIDYYLEILNKEQEEDALI